jgi:hypothetical protein
MDWLWVIAAGVLGYYLYRYVQRRDKAARDQVNSSKALSTEAHPTDSPKSITKEYKGSQAEATALFQSDRVRMAEAGYFPTSQTWVPGEWGAGNFIVALLLCIFLIGILVFLYMLIVKPPGTLTVIYEKQQIVAEEKSCPKCAERIKAAALVCRYCGYEFEPANSDGPPAVLPQDD